MSHPFLRILSTVLLGAVCLAGSGSAGARELGAGRVLIYLEVPAEAPPPTVLTIAEFRFTTADGSVISVLPDVRSLDARRLAGTQIRLATPVLDAGIHTGLTLVLNEVSTKVGTATIFPEVADEGHDIHLDLDLAPGATAAVFLRWRPARESARTQPYQPDLVTVHESLPPLGSLAFVTCRAAGTLMAIDRERGRVVAAQRIGDDPRDVVYSSLQQKFYVALAGEDALAVVDGLSLQLERKVPLRFGDGPDRLALALDETALHVLNEGSRSLATLGLQSLQEQGRVAVGEGPRALAVDAGRVYVACQDAGEVQFVDTGQARILSAITTVAAPADLALDVGGHVLYVSSGVRHRVHAFDLTGGGDPGGQVLCGRAESLAAHPRSAQVYAAVPGCSEVAVVRPSAGLEFAPLRLPEPADRIVFTSDHRQLLAVARAADQLLVCDPQRGTVLARIDLDAAPYAVVAP